MNACRPGGASALVLQREPGSARNRKLFYNQIIGTGLRRVPFNGVKYPAATLWSARNLLCIWAEFL